MMLRSSTLIMGLLVAIGATTGMLACSSSEEEAPADEQGAQPPERSLEGTQPAPIASNTNSGSVPAGDDPLPPPSDDGGAGGEGGGGGGTGTGPGTGGGTGTGGGKGGGGSGTKCEASAPVEKEANDSAATANVAPAVTTSVCGQLSSKSDVDFFKFTLPAATTGFGMGLDYSRAGLKIEVSVDGKTFNVGQTPELEPGKEYLVKVSTTGDGPVDYRWSMQIDQ